jgi:uncharacterized protein (DUF2236 family)
VNADPAASISWQLHREVVLLLGWGRAILLQLAHPLVAAGVAEHSTFLTERRGRLRRLYRTLHAMLRMTFGADEDVLGAAARINAIHDRVHGRLAEAAGVFPAGTPYSAHDPDLLRWVHATLLDSFLLTYELYVGPLAPGDRDRYCEESSEIERLLGIPDGYLPRSHASLLAYLSTMLGSGQIVVTPTARALAREVVWPPAPAPARPILWFMALATIGLLPPAIREAYGFGWTPSRERMLHGSARLAGHVLPWVPGVVRHWPSARAAMRAGREGRRRLPHAHAR